VLWHRVRELIRLRTTMPALQRNETHFFCFHPAIDHDGGERVFASAHTGERVLGSADQVAVVVNLGPHRFPEFWVLAMGGDRPHARSEAPFGIP
jgi:hypothetical protein